MSLKPQATKPPVITQITYCCPEILIPINLCLWPRSVLDRSIPLIMAMVDIAAEEVPETHVRVGGRWKSYHGASLLS